MFYHLLWKKKKIKNTEKKKAWDLALRLTNKRRAMRVFKEDEYRVEFWDYVHCLCTKIYENVVIRFTCTMNKYSKLQLYRSSRFGFTITKAISRLFLLHIDFFTPLHIMYSVKLSDLKRRRRYNQRDVYIQHLKKTGTVCLSPRLWVLEMMMPKCFLVMISFNGF